LRIEQVLTNLISNALKYGDGKPVTIEVRAEGRAAQIVVRDRGIGISPENLGRIFGRFERAVSARNYGGLGLGLYITRQIVEAHGGSIGVESEQGQGSAFFVELPLGEATSRAANEDRDAPVRAVTAARDQVERSADAGSTAAARPAANQ